MYTIIWKWINSYKINVLNEKAYSSYCFSIDFPQML